MIEERGDPRTAGLRTTAPRRSVIKSAGGLALGSLGLGTRGHVAAAPDAQAATPAAPGGARGRPNILYFLVDNLGMGELGCYGGGLLRGTETPRIDRFAAESTKLLNFAPEAQCTPSRSALMTGRYAIRSGNYQVEPAGVPCGLVAWERTMGDILSDAGYATAIYGKWHIGAERGRWPTDHGFDEWYGPPRTYDEALWPEDPWYVAGRDPVSYMMEGRKGEPVQALKDQQLTIEVRRTSTPTYLARSGHSSSAAWRRAAVLPLLQPLACRTCRRWRARNSLARPAVASGAAGVGRLPVGTGHRLRHGARLAGRAGVADNTIVVFSGDNGAEEMEPWRGDPGIFSGSYFTGMEGSLRTPCMIRYPGVVPAGRTSNEIVHITDQFTTLLGWAGAEVPTDRVIDGVDQRAFWEGEERSARQGFPYWNANVLYGVKWGNFKVAMMDQMYLTSPAMTLPTSHIINLVVDPKERKALDYPYVHSWVATHAYEVLAAFRPASSKSH